MKNELGMEGESRAVSCCRWGCGNDGSQLKLDLFNVKLSQPYDVLVPAFPICELTS